MITTEGCNIRVWQDVINGPVTLSVTTEALTTGTEHRIDVLLNDKERVELRSMLDVYVEEAGANAC